MTRGDGGVVTTTDRLTLRTFREDDLPLYAAVNADPEVVEFLDILDPVKVDMEQRLAAGVFVHQHEGGAIHLARTGESAPDALCQAGLARAEFAAQQDDIAFAKLFAQPLAYCARIFFAR